MPAAGTLTKDQQAALYRIHHHHLYDRGVLLRDAYWLDLTVVPAPHPKTLLSLWRKELIEFASEPTLDGSGTSIGRQIKLTARGRIEMHKYEPRTYSTSWRVDPQGKHPRKRARQLKEGDLVLVDMADGRKQWFRVTETATARKLSPGLVEFAIQDAGEDRPPKTLLVSADRRYTVVRNEKEN